MNVSDYEGNWLGGKISSPKIILKNINLRLLFITVVVLVWVFVYRLVLIKVEAPLYLFFIVGEIFETLCLSFVAGYVIYFITTEYPALKRKIITLNFVKVSLPILYRGFREILKPVGLEIEVEEIDLDYFDTREYKTELFEKITEKLELCPKIGGMKRDVAQKHFLSELEKEVISIHRDIIDEFKKKIDTSWHFFDHILSYKLQKMINDTSLQSGMPSYVNKTLGFEVGSVQAFCQDYSFFLYNYNLNLQLIKNELTKYE